MDTYCPNLALTLLSEVSSKCERLPSVLYIISGSFNVVFLYTLAFNTQSRQLNVIGRTDAFGPHQYLAKTPGSDRLYTTTWAWPPSLNSWYIDWNEWDEEEWFPTLEHLNTVPITSTSSYITLRDTRIYSAGGPTGEVHEIDFDTGGFGKKIQELLYVDEDQLRWEDKTRKALRNGSHAIEFTVSDLAFVPHLGYNSIWMYKLDRSTGKLKLLSKNKSPREKDSPRHVIPSPNGKYLYAITEHTSFVDVYEIVNDDHLEHLQSASILPPGTDPQNYRGDTLRLSRKRLPHADALLDEVEPITYLFATTRGATPEYKGYLTAFAISPNGLILNPSHMTTIPPRSTSFSSTGLLLQGKEFFATGIFQTPTSGGRANAIELAPYHVSSGSTSSGVPGKESDAEWMVLTDEEKGWVFVVEWSGRRGTFEIISSVLLEVGVDGDYGKRALASHAIWLA